MVARMMVAHAPTSLIQERAAWLGRPEATAAASRSMGTGRQIYIVASAARQLRKRNSSPHECSVFMMETKDISAILSCFEGIRGHWYTPATASSSECGELRVEDCQRVARVLNFARRSVGQIEDGRSRPCSRELVEPHSVSRPRRVAGPQTTQFIALRIKRTSL